MSKLRKVSGFCMPVNPAAVHGDSPPRIVESVGIDIDLRHAIDRLLQDKLEGREMDDGPRVPLFHEFFDREIPRLESITGTIPPGPKSDVEQLDRFFRQCVGHG